MTAPASAPVSPAAGPAAADSGAPLTRTDGCATPDAWRAVRRSVATAVGCPAAAPSPAVLGLGWRLRSDALFLAAAHAAASGPEFRARAARLRRLAQAWASGAARLTPAGGGWAPTDTLDALGTRRLAWLDTYLAGSASLPEVGGAWALMRAEFWVWRLARTTRGREPPAVAASVALPHGPPRASHAVDG